MKNVSNYCEVFLEATTRAEIDKLIEEYEKKGFKADKPVRKDADEEHFHYFIFMSKGDGGYENSPPEDITATPTRFPISEEIKDLREELRITKKYLVEAKNKYDILKGKYEPKTQSA